MSGQDPGRSEPSGVRHLVRDGVRLAYTEAGAGAPAVMLVHGMRCDHHHMQPLFDHLSARHRVVSVDLRGHGASDAPDSEYSNDEMAGDLAWVADALELGSPVMIGHSFGGSVSLHLAVTQPERVAGLVLLDSGIRSASEKRAEMGSAIPAAAGAITPERSLSFFAERLFGPDDDPTVKAEVLAVMGDAPQHATSRMGQTVLDFDTAEAAVACSTPALLILADRPFSGPETIARLGPNWRIGQVVGSGHFVQLFATQQVNAMVDRFLELLPSTDVAGSAGSDADRSEAADT